MPSNIYVHDLGIRLAYDKQVSGKLVEHGGVIAIYQQDWNQTNTIRTPLDVARIPQFHLATEIHEAGQPGE